MDNWSSIIEKMSTNLQMTAIEKYPKMQDKAFFIEMLTTSVYGNMALEDQEVAMEEVRAKVEDMIAQKELEGFKLFLN